MSTPAQSDAEIQPLYTDVSQNMVSKKMVRGQYLPVSEISDCALITNEVIRLSI